MQIQSYTFQADVIDDDGTQKAITLQRRADGSIYASTNGAPVAPSAVRPDEDAIEALCKAIAGKHPTPQPA
jgi:hypothetical protein